VVVGQDGEKRLVGQDGEHISKFFSHIQPQLLTRLNNYLFMTICPLRGDDLNCRVELVH